MTYKTKIEPQYADTVEQLAGWVRPNHAYVLFETRERDVKTGNIRHALMTLDVNNRPDQAHRLDYYVRVKRFRIIDYGNFPSANSPNPRIAAKAQMHTGPDKVNPWHSLEAACASYMRVNPEWKQEKAALDAKVEELTKKLAEKEAANVKPAKGRSNETTA